MRINGVKTAIKGHTLFEQSGCTINRDLSDAALFLCHAVQKCSKIILLKNIRPSYIARVI